MAKTVKVVPFPPAEIFAGTVEECIGGCDVVFPPPLMRDLHGAAVLEDRQLLAFEHDRFARFRLAGLRLLRGGSGDLFCIASRLRFFLRPLRFEASYSLRISRGVRHLLSSFRPLPQARHRRPEGGNP